jgi:hypothetical protein
MMSVREAPLAKADFAVQVHFRPITDVKRQSPEAASVAYLVRLGRPTCTGRLA